MKIAISTLFLFAAVSASAQQTPVDYRFDEVTRKVVVTTAQKQLPAVKGLHAQGGRPRVDGVVSPMRCFRRSTTAPGSRSSPPPTSSSPRGRRA